ncbi:DUF4329 domain-containing protein [Pseudomonas coronafaciens]|uniref:DUF4329 domain-containing protein n=1 Tax=Pseudomonas coronafaciens pv. coronafaciens TaxID=235275 RepID=A0AAE6UNR6_9PSED|nr:DUF4329 domain-containing protein [Pseudomonas coronafaciens]QGT82871.1 DUF4329 domain-containing protein [Pseudomonas coronafaciens pv. coronafaciens]QIQ70706.1 hypothetical protein HBB04_01063 [Pseudomonas coronafaciens]RMM84111.1 hypothetical protein ALQ71_00149 [Pseudomonas coronafaciens pv. striafaciens]RMN22962.1 hypothetical protein ALQ62_03099 [Pseudomonas coronafaciens pv. zizaniae]
MYLRTKRPKRSAGDRGHPAMPTLSAPFDHPDEAARYAHERIGNRRDREYGGFILVRDDGKYVATEPMNGSQFSFDPNEVFPRNDEEGYVLYPEGHDDYAIYHSHPSLQAGLEEWPEPEKVTYPNSFSAGDIYAVISDEICPAFYLSGPDGSLIKYTLSHSAAETALFARVAGPSGIPHLSRLSEVQRSLQNLTLMPSDVVRLLAAAGDLQVVIPSLLWGRAGKVSADWRPFPGQLASDEPRVSAPATCEAVLPPVPLSLSPQFSSADDGARYVHGQIGARIHSPIIGFLLFNPVLRTYLVAEPILEDGYPVYAPCSVFHPDAFYRPALPAGYRVDGMYFSPANLAAEGVHETQRPFFEPDDLHRVFTYRHIPAKRPKGLPIRYGFEMSAIYFLAGDGALLCYTPSKSVQENQLAQGVSRVYSGAQSIQAQLAAGTISADEFVRHVARAGHLRVLQTSKSWPVAGVISHMP